MSDTIKELIKRFDKHKNVSEAKFQFLLDRQKSMEKALLEMQEESSDFYSFVAESLGELDKEISLIKEKSRIYNSCNPTQTLSTYQSNRLD